MDTVRSSRQYIESIEMFTERVGCLVWIGCAIVSFAVPASLGWGVDAILNLNKPILLASIAGVFGLIMFFTPMLDQITKFEIRKHVKAMGGKVEKITIFETHYRVEYIVDGKKMKKKWPEDFQVIE